FVWAVDVVGMIGGHVDNLKTCFFSPQVSTAPPGIIDTTLLTRFQGDFADFFVGGRTRFGVNGAHVRLLAHHHATPLQGLVYNAHCLDGAIQVDHKPTTISDVESPGFNAWFIDAGRAETRVR